MSDKPLVSAIIIFLNEEHFIQGAIDSVLAQSFDRWELLLVNDGSTDKSTEIALRYAEQYPNIEELRTLSKGELIQVGAHRIRDVETSKTLQPKLRKDLLTSKTVSIL